MYKRTIVLLFFVFMAWTLCGPMMLPAHAQETRTEWELWIGSHYTGLDQYIAKVAEFDRGKEGLTPELAFRLFRQTLTSTLQLTGWYYDPKRMSFDFLAQTGDTFRAQVSFLSFFRFLQNDLLQNAATRESLNREGTRPGGKMLTVENPNIAERFGYTRRELKTALEFRIPGLSTLRFRFNHRSIFENGTEQRIITMHCSSCHLESRTLDVNRQIHDVGGTIEADLGKVTVSYQARYRVFDNRIDQPVAFYDPAQHPVTGGARAEFASRVIFEGEEVPYSIAPDVRRLSHAFKTLARLGRGTLAADLTFSTGKNKAMDLTARDTRLHLRFTYPIAKRLKWILAGRYGRLKNDPVFIDRPPWRAGRPGGGQDFDWTRYSNLTRTLWSASSEWLVRFTRRFRGSLLVRVDQITRDDYPEPGGDHRTTTWHLGPRIELRPSQRLTARLGYTLEHTTNPFAAIDHLFEASGRTLQPLPGNPFVYYWQRDALRYGDITPLPETLHRVQARLELRPTPAWTVRGDLTATFGSNHINPQLDFQNQFLQADFSLFYRPTPLWNLYAHYTYMYQDQNGLLSVALMDG